MVNQFKKYKKVKELIKGIEESLDHLVLTLQESAFEAKKKSKKFLDVNYVYTDAYLQSVAEINGEFDTSYETRLAKIEEYFEKTRPLKRRAVKY